MIRGADVIVIGAGMAGASVAAELAPHCRVIVLEAEDQPGRHSTGRSAAMFFESYGNETVRALTRASRAFLEHPPEGFATFPLLRPRDALIVGDAGQVPRLEAIVAEPDATATLRLVDAATAMSRCPILRRERLAAAVLDESGHDMDVAAIHQGYLRLARRAGAELLLDARDLRIERGAGWRLHTSAGEFHAPVVVNAAGAWADVVAALAGVRTIGLQPMRRSVAMLPAPAGIDIDAWPMVIGVDEDFYFKPDAGQLLLSPANEDPSPPCDAVPEELDIAIAVDRFERATTLPVVRVLRRWAGLRSFVADRSPVVGFDADGDGFFWFAGQGGYGIQMAPALARVAAAQILRRPMPDDVQREGLASAALSPARAACRREGAAPAA